jgi:hypothetical protein
MREDLRSHKATASMRLRRVTPRKCRKESARNAQGRRLNEAEASNASEIRRSLPRSTRSSCGAETADRPVRRARWVAADGGEQVGGVAERRKGSTADRAPMLRPPRHPGLWTAQTTVARPPAHSPNSHIHPCNPFIHQARPCGSCLDNVVSTQTGSSSVAVIEETLRSFCG